MSRVRTGTLVPPGRDGIWKGRVTADDGTRPLYSLGTTDEATAKRKLARLAAGEAPAAITEATRDPRREIRSLLKVAAPDELIQAIIDVAEEDGRVIDGDSGMIVPAADTPW